MNILKLSLTVAFLTTGLSMTVKAQSMERCNPSWPLVAIETKNSSTSELAIRVAPTLISNEDKTGNVFLSIASQLSPWAEVRGDELLGSFINENKKEAWLPIAKVIETEEKTGAKCYRLELSKNVSVREVVETYRPECFPLPKWMCGTKKTSLLEFNSTDNKGYYLRSIMSVNH